LVRTKIIPPKHENTNYLFY